MKKTNILSIVAIIISIILFPSVFAACEGLQYEQCNGACRPAGNFYHDYLQNGNQADCIYYPACVQGDIFVSGTWVENLFCCSDNQVGCPPAQSSSYTGYSEVYCLNSYNCVSNCTSGLNVCEINGQQQCINLQTDVNNCGQCGNHCQIGEMCQSGICTATYVPSCPNGVIDPILNEECDDNNYNYNDACTQNCKDAFCGDGFIWDYGSLGTEQCDGLDFDGKTCGSLTGMFSGELSCTSNNCQIDTSGCYEECGNGYCESGENSGNCLIDCKLDGWQTFDEGWSRSIDNMLVGATPDVPINIYSDPFDLKLGKNYTLNAVIYNPDGCTLFVDLNDGSCLDSQSFTLINNCFDDSGFRITSTSRLNKALPSASNHALQGFFRNVSVRIRVEDCPLGASFDNITLKEVSDLGAQNSLQPSINLTTACCPENYCWTGSECVLPTDEELNWENSKKPNLWSALDIDGQKNKHVNISMQWLAKGYRCELNKTGYANWVPAKIKYDWDFEESGYCIKETDCFVGHDYSNNTGNGDQCIRTGEFIDNYNDPIINTGNHYCMDGVWTTKTYLIANVLENLSIGKPFILFCDDTGRIFNNIEEIPTAEYPNSDGNYIGGGCVLIIKEGSSEKVLTGFYAQKPPIIAPEAETDDSDIMCGIYTKHIASYFGEENVVDCAGMILDGTLVPSYQSCDGYGQRAFVQCGQYTAHTPRLYLYVNTEQYYYIMSANQISEFNTWWLGRLWNSITGFFRQLFGYAPSEPLGLANQTTNYERIYLLSNHTMNVSALEESKYDEELARTMVYMYLNMTAPGLSQTNNPLNIAYINNTVGGAYYTFNNGANTQKLIIKYYDAAELWPYLTAMLRDRP